MKIGVGDTVKVWKWVYDREYSIIGVVEKIQPSRTRGDQSMFVNGDWYGSANDIENKCEVIERAETSYPQWMRDIAKQYGLSVNKVYDLNMDFLQNEGCIETSHSVIEFEAFDQYLKLATKKPHHQITEPYQKGDLGYGL